MKTRRVISSLLLASFLAPSLIALTGCEAGSGQIPLADVPPPPPGFANQKEAAKAPTGASPADANERRK